MIAVMPCEPRYLQVVGIAADLMHVDIAAVLSALQHLDLDISVVSSSGTPPCLIFMEISNHILWPSCPL